MEEANDTGVEAEVPDLPVVEEGTEDTTDWKATALKMQGMAKRFKTKIDKITTQPKPQTTTTPKTEAQQVKQGFDYGQLAYLESKGISEAADQGYLEQLAKESGTELRDLLGKSWVQAELKERKDLRMAEAATPTGSKRAGNTTRDQVDYWLAKGQMPPADQPELRQKYVTAKIKAEESRSQFTSQSVVQ